MLYEKAFEGAPEPCGFARRLAAHGIAEWADVTHTDTGEWLTPAQARVWYGWKQGAREDTEYERDDDRTDSEEVYADLVGWATV